MNALKRNFVDFICAFLAFTIILLSIALVTNKSFADGAVVFDKENGSLLLFGTRFELRQDVLSLFDGLLSFNDNLFGSGFSEGVKNAAEFFAEYVGDFLKMAFVFAENAVGAR